MKYLMKLRIHPLIYQYMLDKMHETPASSRCFPNPFMVTTSSTSTADLEPPEILTLENFKVHLKLYCERILAHFPPNHPRASYDIYHGLAGIALLFFRIHERDPGFNVHRVHDHGDAREEELRGALPLAQEYIEHAVTLADHELRRRLTEGSTLGSHCGFICSTSGTYSLAAVIMHHIGNFEARDRHLEQLVQLSKVAFSRAASDELFYGRSGYLYALGHALHEIGQPATQLITTELLQTIVDIIIRDGQELKSSDPSIPTPLMYEWHGKQYLGAAHGVLGIVATLLQFPAQIGEYKEELLQTIDQIHHSTFDNGNIPTSLPSNNRQLVPSKELVQFCHGVPGLVLACIKAYEAGGGDHLLKWAKEGSEVIWERGLLTKGIGLCHGIDGNALVFLSLYRHTLDRHDWERTLAFLSFGVHFVSQHSSKWNSTRIEKYSLFEGLAGLANSIVDVVYWDQEVFKGFPCWTDLWSKTRTVALMNEE